MTAMEEYIEKLREERRKITEEAGRLRSDSSWKEFSEGRKK